MSPYFFKRILKRPLAPAASLLLVGILAVLLSSLTAYRRTQHQKLLQIQSNAEIPCVVTDRRGVSSNSLRMNYGAISMVTDYSYSKLVPLIRDVRITKEFTISSALTGDSDAFGVTSERCLELTDPAFGARTSIDRENFYNSDDLICIVSKKLYDQLDEEKLLTVFITDPFINRKHFPELGFGSYEFKVCGYYLGEETSVIMPFTTAMRICDEISQRKSCDAITFLAKDNLKLDELSAAAGEYFGAVDPYASEFSTPRYALTIHDEDYRTMVAAIRQNIVRSTYFLPLVGVFALLSGIIVGFLATRHERTRYALMRSVGMTKQKLLTSTLLEQILFPFVVAVLVGIVSGHILAALLAFVLYALGCIAAVIRAISVSPTQLLREQE